MAKHTSSETTPEEQPLIEVEALITEWRTGKYGGRYALARIQSPDAPTRSALCNEMLMGVEPPLNEPFRCLIQEKPKGWSIVELVIDGFQQSFTNLPGIVAQIKTLRGRALWMIETRPVEEGPILEIALSQTSLEEAKLQYIDLNTPVVVDATRDQKGYVVTKVVSPTAAMAVPETHQGPVISEVLTNWTREATAKGIYLAARAPGASVSAKVFLHRSLLVRAGLSRLVRSEHSREHNPAESDAVLMSWERTLRTGSREDCALLEINQLEIQLEWLASSQSWRVERLLRPRAVREPVGEKEIIDWVTGKVMSSPRPFSKPHAADKETSSKETTSSDTVASANVLEVDIAFDDERVGRGMTKYRAGQHAFANAALAEGVPVIVRLESNKEYWNISGLHRSSPTDVKEAP